MSYYCPPSTTISKKFLSDALSISKNLIVLGDLNAHHTSWHSQRNNQSGSILDEILFNTDCTNINYDIPTYQPIHRPDYYAILDFIICSDSLSSSVTDFRVSDLLRRDHLTLEFNLQLNSTSSISNSKTTKTIRTTDWDQFQLNLLNSTIERPSCLRTKEEIDQAANIIVHNIQEAIQQASKCKTIKVNPNKFMIFPNHIIVSIKNKRKAQRKFLKTRNPLDKAEFNKKTIETKQLIEQHKQKTWRSFCNSLNLHSVSDATLWKKPNSIDSNSKLDKPQTIILKPNNVTIDNPEEISNIFAKLLAKTFSDPEDPNFDDQFKTQVNNNKNDFFKDNVIEPELTNSFEIQELIDKLKPRGAPGADRITNKAIKKLTPNFIELLVEIVNASLKLAHLPSIWKTAHIIMIPKPMKDHSQPENFRPISLLNTLSKLCERVIQVRINRWLSNNNIISDYQSGFCKGKQTNDHLYRFIESTIVGFNRGLKKGLNSCGIHRHRKSLRQRLAYWTSLQAQ